MPRGPPGHHSSGTGGLLTLTPALTQILTVILNCFWKPQPTISQNVMLAGMHALISPSQSVKAKCSTPIQP